MAKNKKIIYLNPEEEAKEKEQENKPKNKKKHRILRKVPYAFAAALLIFLAIIIFSVRQGITVETAKVSVTDFFKGESISKNFPIELDGLKVKDMQSIGNSVGVLNDVKLNIYSPKGRLINELQHNMVEPKMTASKTRALIYEHGNRKIMVASLTKSVLTKQYETEVIAADMNMRNNFAVAVLGDRYLSEVHLYNSDGDEELTWYSADNYVVSVAVSPDSSRVAVALYNTVNGDNKGSVYIIDKKKTDAPVAQYTYEGETVFSVEYNDDGILTAIGDKATYCYDKDGSPIGEYVYEADLQYFTSGQGKKTVLGMAGNGNTTFLTTDQTGTVTATVQIKEKVDFFTVYKDTMYLIVGGNVLIYDILENSFELKATVTAEDISQGAISVVPGGGGIFVLTPDEIRAA